MEKSRIQITRQDQGEPLSTSSQDLNAWIFDPLPYADLTKKTFSPPDNAKVTTRRSDTMKRKKAEEEEVKSKNKDGQLRRFKEDRDVRGDAIMVNLLLSEFYDSGQLFKSYVFDFWPLCIGILNLPPNHRGNVKRYLTLEQQREDFRA
eukprot:gene54119-72327_t